jgi:transcriptional regulator
MYIPHYFKNENMEDVLDFIQKNSFAVLVSNGDDKLLATHTPLMVSRDEAGHVSLFGHISKGNPQWTSFQNNQQILAIFQGSHSYISPSWYNHENVPTWNYIAVHVYGRITIIEGDELLEAMNKLVNNFEKAMEHPMRLEHLSDSFVQHEIKGIVGFKITIDDIQAAYKLSQNRDRESHDNIIRELEKSGDEQSAEIASMMKKHGRS